MNLKGLKEKRNELVSKMKSMQVGAEIDKRCLNDDENMLFDLLEKEVRSLDEQIQGSKKIERGGKMESKELRSAEDQFNLELREGGTTLLSAGVTVPTIISADIVKNVQEISDVLNDCKIIKQKGKYKQIVRTGGNRVAFTKELSKVTPSKGEYEGIEIGHHKCSGLDIVSVEIWNESQFNLSSEIMENLKEDLAVTVENAIFNGTGEDQPTGLLKDKTFTAVDLTADLLIDMVTSLKKKYLKGAKFYVSRPTLAKIRKLKDLEGRYLFDPITNMVLGHPVAITESLNDEIIFGNFKLGYAVNWNPEMILRILQEKYMDIGAYGVVLHSMIDGKPIDPNAFAINKISA